jgi:DNA-binding LacI/PurR family transcriptional regulator
MDIIEVAKRAKVSTATVSRVLNGSADVSEKTSARVRKIVAELNYVPNSNARNLRVGSTRLFGLIVSDIKNPFFPELIDGFEALAATKSIDVIFTHTDYDPKRLLKCVRRMVDRNVDGIAVMTSEVDEEALAQAEHARIPLVLLNQMALQDRFSNVLVDYSQGFGEAIEHLLSLGHRDIGFIAGPQSLASARRRKQAFQAALRKCGLRLHAEWTAVGDMRVEGGKRAMEQILAGAAHPTAIVATNDLMAIGAIETAREAGVRIPDDISLVGFDDLPISSMVYPTLSTIHLSRAEIALRAFNALIDAVKSGNKILLPSPPVRPRLVVRQSTGKLASG